MAALPSTQRLIRFAVFEIDLLTGELRKSGAKVRLQDKPFQLLATLLERPGELVTREELQQKLWPDGTFVDFEHGLATAIKKIRQALGDSADTPRFIETLPRRGFRFIAPLDPPNGHPNGGKELAVVLVPPAAPEVEVRPQRRKWYPVLAGFLVLAVGVAVTVSRPTVPPPVVTGTVQITHDGRAKGPPIVTDGTRLYFTEFIGGRPTPVAVPVTGGEPVPIRSPLEKAAVLDISRTGDQLLVLEGVLDRDDVPVWVLPAVGGIPVRVGDLMAREAVWSPDGTRIVYIKGQDLYLATEAGTQSRRVASPRGGPYFLRWSPEGKRISVSVGDVASAALWELSPNGADFHPRLPGWNNSPMDCSGSWSPDGRYFLFDSYRDGPDGVWVVREKGSLLERWSSKPVLLLEGPGNAGKPIVSRDGKQIFYMATPAAKVGLARFNMRTTSWTPFLPGISAEQVSFSRLGGSIAYVSFPGRQLFKANADGKEPLQLTSPPLEAACPRWSPDGKKIAFMGHLPGKNWQIYVVAAKGGDPHLLFGTGVEEADPDWSPDGGSLLFFRSLLQGQKASDPVLFILDLRTNRITPIPGSGDCYYARFSPDGRYIASTREFTRVVLFDRKTGKWEELAKGDVYAPCWSRTSEYVYFLDWSTNSYCHVRVSDHRREPMLSMDCLAGGGVRNNWIEVGPDDSPIAFTTTAAEIFAANWKAP